MTSPKKKVTEKQEIRKKNPGRPKKSDDQIQMNRIFDQILGKLISKNPKISKEEIQKQLDLSPLRTRTILNNLSAIMSRVQVTPDEILLTDNGASYYWSQVSVNSDLKEAIARKTAEFIPSNSTLGCSPGTTVVRTIPRILKGSQYMSIITNNCGVLDQIFHHQHSTLEFTGGTYNPAIHACIGEKTVTAFKEARCSSAVVGVSGIDEAGRLFVKVREEVGVLKQILDSTTDEVNIVASVDKLAQSDMWCFHSIPDLDDENRLRNIRLITNPLEDLSRCNISEKEREHRTNSAKKVFNRFDKYIVVAECE